LNVKAKGMEGRKVRISPYNREQFVQIFSSANVHVDERSVDMNAKYILDDIIMLDASTCKPSDIVSITITVEELSEYEVEKRGLSTLIRIE
jgi:hypothetical protein